MIIDYAYSSKETIFDLQSSNLDVNDLIPNHSIYGNIISFKTWTDPEEKIAKLCSRYYGGIAHRLVTALINGIA